MLPDFTSMADSMPQATTAFAAAGQAIWTPRWMKNSTADANAEALSCRAEPYAPSPQLTEQAERRRATWYSTMVLAACEAGVPTRLFDALVIQESRYNPVAVSPKGAAGLAQLMPASARILGVRNIWDPRENMRGGAHYLRSLLDEFGRFDLALAAYNAGAGRVRVKHQVPRIAETVHYVSNILVTMQRQISRSMEDQGWGQHE